MLTIAELEALTYLDAMEFEKVTKEMEMLYEIKKSKYDEVSPKLDDILIHEAYNEVMQSRRINALGEINRLREIEQK